MTANTPIIKTITDEIQAELTLRLAFMKTLQARARAITLPLFVTDIDAQNKSATGYDPVTQADMDWRVRMTGCGRLIRLMVRGHLWRAYLSGAHSLR